jgi:uncharacterized protein YbaR (Trm112 family)
LTALAALEDSFAMPISDTSLLEYLACPEDKGPLWYFADEDILYNPRLQRRYPIREGIPVLLIDEAESVTRKEHDRLMAKAEADGVGPNFDPDA